MRDKGLTLVEVLVTTGIAVVAGILLVAIIVNSAGIYHKESSKLTEGLNINDALSKIRSTIKESSAVATSFTGDSVVYTSSATQLILKIASIDASGNIIASVFDYYVFFLDNNTLKLKTFPDPSSSRKAQDQIFSTSVNSLLFQYLNLSNPSAEVPPQTAGKVRITITLRQKSGADVEIKTATSEAILRND